MANLIVKYSGGNIKNLNQANFVLVCITVVIFASAFIVFSTKHSTSKLDPDVVTKMGIEKMQELYGTKHK